MKKNLDYFIKKYLENRPMFLAIIRSQEAMFFQKYKKFIKGKTLDFGCGDGFFAEVVFGKGRIDVGLDLINSRAKTAEKNSIYKKVVYYTGEKIPFANNYFSTIVSNCVLEHIPNLSKLLKEIRRVLKPNGYFLTSVMTDKWEKYLLGQKIIGKKYLEIMRKKQEHYHLLTVKKWWNLFQKSGFKIIKTIPYMSKKQTTLMEIAHYLSIPSLISYWVFKKWVLLSKWYKFLFIDKLIKKLLSEKNLTEENSSLFLLLKKEKDIIKN